MRTHSSWINHGTRGHVCWTLGDFCILCLTHFLAFRSSSRSVDWKSHAAISIDRPALVGPARRLWLLQSRYSRVEKHFNFSKHFASTGSQLGNSEWSMPSISNSAQRYLEKAKGDFSFQKASYTCATAKRRIRLANIWVGYNPRNHNNALGNCLEK